MSVENHLARHIYRVFFTQHRERYLSCNVILSHIHRIARERNLNQLNRVSKISCPIINLKFSPTPAAISTDISLLEIKEYEPDVLCLLLTTIVQFLRAELLVFIFFSFQKYTLIRESDVSRAYLIRSCRERRVKCHSRARFNKR